MDHSLDAGSHAADSLRLAPSERFVNWQQDSFGNFTARLVFPEPAKAFPFAYEPQLARDLELYLQPEGPAGPELTKWLSGVRLPDGGIAIAGFLVELNRRLYNDIAYSIRMELGVQTPEDTLTRGIGSCRDTGWVGLDPTSGLFAGEGHIPPACTPHQTTTAPISGRTNFAEVEFDFSNVVRRVREDPRVTLPYTPEQWARIDKLGEKVDERLEAGDVRLTMRVEPTFVFIDDMEGAQWNTAADGHDKRVLAYELAQQMHDKSTTGGLIQHGQSKWYPGEPLPRWQMGIVWRNDDKPLWARGDLLADPAQQGTATVEDAQRFADAIAAGFGIDTDRVIPAFEDPIDQVWREARLPGGDPPTADAEPADVDQIDELDARVRLVERLRGPVTTDPTGFVIPLHPAQDGTGWRTASWNLRRERMCLIAGDSPLGLRLPTAISVSFFHHSKTPTTQSSCRALSRRLPANSNAPS